MATNPHQMPVIEPSRKRPEDEVIPFVRFLVGLVLVSGTDIG